MDWSQFTTNSGTRIDFARVAEVGVGTVFAAVFTGWVSVVLGLADIPLALLAGLADFGGQVVAIVAGLPAVIIERGFVAAVPFVLDAGIAGFLVAVVIVLGTLYSLEWVVSRVRQ